MPKPNYNRARKQRELARKSRQLQKQQRRMARSNSSGEHSAAAAPNSPVRPSELVSGDGTT